MQRQSVASVRRLRSDRTHRRQRGWRDRGYGPSPIYVNDFGSSNPLRYSRVSRRSAFLSSTKVSDFPSNTRLWPAWYEMLPRCGGDDEGCPPYTSQLRSFGSPARLASL